MKIYIFKHNKFEASWSQFDEPNVFPNGYMFAEIVVLANDIEEAYGLLAEEKGWSIEDLRRIEPRIMEVDESRIITKYVNGG